jgi:hypothetical protein
MSHFYGERLDEDLAECRAQRDALLAAAEAASELFEALAEADLSNACDSRIAGVWEQVRAAIAEVTNE